MGDMKGEAHIKALGGDKMPCNGNGARGLNMRLGSATGEGDPGNIVAMRRGFCGIERTEDGCSGAPARTTPRPGKTVCKYKFRRILLSRIRRETAPFLELRE